MRRILFLILTALFVLLFSVEFPAPTPYKYVNDYVGVLDSETVEKIVAVGKELEKKRRLRLLWWWFLLFLVSRWKNTRTGFSGNGE